MGVDHLGKCSCLSQRRAPFLQCYIDHDPDHCLETIRQAILCNAEPTFVTYYWLDKDKIKGNRTGLRHCVNWENIQSWAEGRTVQLDPATFVAKSLVEGTGP